MSIAGALRTRAFPVVIGGQMIRRLGDHVFGVALIVWLIQRSGSATDIATTETALTIPSLVLLIAGGLVADRLPRVAVIFLADAMRAVAVGAVAIAAVSGHLEIWGIWCCSFIFGIATAFFRPAYR